MLCVPNMESDEVRYQVRIAQWKSTVLLIRVLQVQILLRPGLQTLTIAINDHHKRPEGSERLSNRFYLGIKPGPDSLNENPVFRMDCIRRR